MVVNPLSMRETSLANPASPGMQLGICFAVTKYDSVLRRIGTESTRFKPKYDNLPVCVEDCFCWQEMLIKFGTKH